MKSTLTRIRKLGKQYRRFSINYGIPLLILGVVWGNIKGYVKTTYEFNNEIGSVKEEKEYKKEVRKLRKEIDFLRGRTEYHICMHSRSVEECAITIPLHNEYCDPYPERMGVAEFIFIKVFNIEIPISDTQLYCDADGDNKSSPVQDKVDIRFFLPDRDKI